MANLNTAKQEVIRILHLDSTTLGSSVVSDVTRELIRSMTYYETETPWFLQEKVQIGLESGKGSYDIDPYYQSIMGPPIFIPDVADPSVCWPIDVQTYAEVRVGASLQDSSLSSSTITSGKVRKIAVSASDGMMHVTPVPDTDTQAIELIISRSSQIPTYEYSGSAWVFTDPDGVTTLSDTFENVWLKYGYDLIVNRTLYKLLAGTYGGSESAMMRSQGFKAAADEELNRLRNKHNNRVAALEIPRHI